jgi:hypothetical protein
VKVRTLITMVMAAKKSEVNGSGENPPSGENESLERGRAVIVNGFCILREKTHRIKMAREIW